MSSLKENDINGIVLAIATLAKQIEFLHPFADGNLRTVRALVIKLLNDNNLPLTSIEDPNILDGRSSAQFAEAIKIGMNYYNQHINPFSFIQQKAQEVVTLWESQLSDIVISILYKNSPEIFIPLVIQNAICKFIRDHKSKDYIISGDEWSAFGNIILSDPWFSPEIIAGIENALPNINKFISRLCAFKKIQKEGLAHLSLDELTLVKEIPDYYKLFKRDIDDVFSRAQRAIQRNSRI